ncbi:hypothetical protein CK203_113624 [Vitis vinifera]|uniref:Uncharacterized protein n=1 Tax=Vitis vinifera TaxID=29760 RepID=A0A438C512_VITVI|nr:hypothetical protein CK203_113624 [Vitis vinifera]
METKSFNATTNSLPSNSAGHNKKSPNDKKSPARKKALRSRVWKQSVAASFLPPLGWRDRAALDDALHPRVPIQHGKLMDQGLMRDHVKAWLPTQADSRRHAD